MTETNTLGYSQGIEFHTIQFRSFVFYYFTWFRISAFNIRIFMFNRAMPKAPSGVFFSKPGPEDPDIIDQRLLGPPSDSLFPPLQSDGM